MRKIGINLDSAKVDWCLRNELQKPNMPSNAHNIANTTWNWTKLPPNKYNFERCPTICKSKKQEKY